MENQPVNSSSIPPTHLPKQKKGLSYLWNHSSGAVKLSLAIIVVIILSTAIYAVTQKTDTNSLKQVAAAQVSINSEGFSPQTLGVKSGTIVTWTNTDTNPHQVAADPYPKNDSIPGFDSTTVLQKDDTYSFTFSKKGTYHVHDQLKPLNLNATIRVE